MSVFMEGGKLEISIKNARSKNGTSNELNLQVMGGERFNPTAFTIPPPPPSPSPHVSIWLTIWIKKLIHLFAMSQTWYSEQFSITVSLEKIVTNNGKIHYLWSVQCLYKPASSQKQQLNPTESLTNRKLRSNGEEKTSFHELWKNENNVIKYRPPTWHDKDLFSASCSTFPARVRVQLVPFAASTTLQ